MSLTEKILKKMESENPRPEVTRRDGVLRILDKTFTTRAGNISQMDIYMPENPVGANAGGKLPVIVAIHGGGFYVGSKAYYDQAGEDLAKKGFLVCSVDYRLMPGVTVFDEMSDVCSAMDELAGCLEEYGGDPDRVYVMGESAGAWLAVYINALSASETLRGISGCNAPKLRIRAMTLFFGMFYTDSLMTTLTMAKSMFGKGTKQMKPYRNPENEEIIGAMPPTLFITSDADFLKKDSCKYCEALKKRGIKGELINMGPDKKLTHAITVMRPDYPECIEAMAKAGEWFKNHM